ncbi:PEP-CTERM sorting domain-containing protein [Poriferisphaera sp. WC338]|uniref:PEP-CTERM sorting domain-containing protein n=1 Tax=Poriferisphaera sp. WC338 TaxID=3425129 RepID=UPI003D81A206
MQFSSRHFFCACLSGVIGLLLGGAAQAAPFAVDVAINGMTKQFVTMKDLTGSTPEGFLSGSVTGPASLGAASEHEVPLGQYVYIRSMSGPTQSIYAIFDKLGVVQTARLFGVDRSSVKADSFPLRAPATSFNVPRVASSGGLFGTPAETPSVTPVTPNFGQIDFGVGSDPVPEPASILLLLLGLSALAARPERHT